MVDEAPQHTFTGEWVGKWYWKIRSRGLRTLMKKREFNYFPGRKEWHVSGENRNSWQHHRRWRFLVVHRRRTYIFSDSHEWLGMMTTTIMTFFIFIFIIKFYDDIFIRMASEAALEWISGKLIFSHVSSRNYRNYFILWRTWEKSFSLKQRIARQQRLPECFKMSSHYYSRNSFSKWNEILLQPSLFCNGRERQGWQGGWVMKSWTWKEKKDKYENFLYSSADSVRPIFHPCPLLIPYTLACRKCEGNFSLHCLNNFSILNGFQMQTRLQDILSCSSLLCYFSSLCHHSM